jgi:WD40 repeat protein
MLGHFNSVKALAISESLGSTEVRYIASASQDQNIRIWKIKPLINEDEIVTVDWEKKY